MKIKHILKKLLDKKLEEQYLSFGISEINLFALAEIQLQIHEGKNPEDKDYSMVVINRAIKIRHYLDISERNKKVQLNKWKNKKLK